MAYCDVSHQIPSTAEHIPGRSMQNVTGSNPLTVTALIFFQTLLGVIVHGDCTTV